MFARVAKKVPLYQQYQGVIGKKHQSESYLKTLERVTKFDPSARKITQFSTRESHIQKFKDFNLATELDWSSPNSISLKEGNIPQTTSQHEVEVYTGGLSMLFKAVDVAEVLQRTQSKKKAIFINDGGYPIYKQSGFQLHLHGTQFPDYNCLYLWRKLLESNIPLFQDSPDSQHYDSLHLPLKRAFLDNPMSSLATFAKCYWNQVKHDIASVNCVTKKDKKLCKSIIASFRNYQQLNTKIVETLGTPIIVQNGRFYYSYDAKGIYHRLTKWSELGIPVKIMSRDQLIQRSIIRADAIKDIHAFSIFGDKDIPPDGYAKPNLMETVILYAQTVFPKHFEHKKATVLKVFMDSNTQVPKALSFTDEAGNMTTTNVSNFQASLGYTNVVNEKRQGFYSGIPVTGASVNFVMSIPMRDLLKRKLGGSENVSDLETFIMNNGILPSADLGNLHMTVFDQEITNNGIVKLYCRATQGANFNEFAADKRDFVSIVNKLNEFYEGEIDLVSLGSCSRFTGLENMPKMNGPFLNSQSGVGLSYAAANYETEIIK